ncbi:hypothetical protein J6590_006029 [Homalodisca vitripennis]|nr:hypothetical protein J6590_006029 [Homalodisca vitripennis]
MAKIYKLHTLTLLIDVFVSALPVKKDIHHLSFEEEEQEDTVYGEGLQKYHSTDFHDDSTFHIDLVEELSDTIVWDRRRRSLEATEKISTTTLAGEDLVTSKLDEGKEDETTTSMPSYLRMKEKWAKEECRKKRWKMLTDVISYNRHWFIGTVCNKYCCFYQFL